MSGLQRGICTKVNIVQPCANARGSRSSTQAGGLASRQATESRARSGVERQSACRGGRPFRSARCGLVFRVTAWRTIERRDGIGCDHPCEGGRSEYSTVRGGSHRGDLAPRDPCQSNHPVGACHEWPKLKPTMIAAGAKGYEPDAHSSGARPGWPQPMPSRSVGRGGTRPWWHPIEVTAGDAARR
jgi:hypothetical protein